MPHLKNNQKEHDIFGHIQYYTYKDTNHNGGGKKVSQWVHLLSIMRAQISEPIPQVGQPCSTVTRWFVFTTDCSMVGVSRGRRDLRLITSHSMPWPASSLAASKANSTALECATNVTWFPEVHGEKQNYYEPERCLKQMSHFNKEKKFYLVAQSLLCQ